MIVHNRGWGPQLEDALFVDRITGHFRFAGMARGVPVATTIPRPTPAMVAAAITATPMPAKAVVKRISRYLPTRAYAGSVRLVANR